MLLIAIPKSASTALMETVARTHGLTCDMHYRWAGAKSEEFPKFGLQHDWDLELDTAAAEHAVTNDALFKLHILPTHNNLTLLKGRKKAVLLRQPEGIVGAYQRGHETGVYPQKTDSFSGCVTQADWLQRAKELGVYDDLKRFREKWLEVDDEKLIIHFEDLTASPQREISRFEDYFGLRKSGTQQLLKRKYTRMGDDSLKLHRATQMTWKETARDK